MSMVERVARALDPEAFGETFEDEPAIIKRRVAERKAAAIKRARAAIEAMMEPDEAMLEASSAGFAQEPSWDDPMQHYLQRARNSFKAALSTALQTKEPR